MYRQLDIKREAQRQKLSRSLRAQSDVRKAALIEAVARTGVVLRTCEALDIPYSTYCQWMRSDPEFADAINLAREQFGERVMEVAVRKALEGIPRVVLYKGQPVEDPINGGVLIEPEYSDRMLEILLKTYRPETRNLDAPPEQQITHNVRFVLPDKPVLPSSTGIIDVDESDIVSAGDDATDLEIQ